MWHMTDVKGFYHVLIFMMALIKVHLIDKKMIVLERRFHIGTQNK